MNKEEKLVKKYPSPLHQIEHEALKVVLDMAKGNLHCPRDDKRRNAVKVRENMIKKS